MSSGASDSDASTGATTGSASCDEIDCGPNGSCSVDGDEAVCACDEGYVPIEETCVSTEDWKLDEGHWVPAKMPMTLVHPRPDGETNDWARHRVAHPDFAYEIPMGIQGGAWPFRYELLEGPEGATVGEIYGQADYGIVRWDPPASGTYAFEVRITDQDLETTTATWSVTIDPSAFVFVDGDDGDDAGSGTIDDPLRSFAGWYLGDSDDTTYAAKVLVFREASQPYLMSGDPVDTDNNCRITSATKPVVWIGFPGERPVIDASESKVVVASPREDLYIAGLRFEHGRQDVNNAHFFWVTSPGHRTTFWRNEYYDLHPGQVGNDNTGPVFVVGTDQVNQYVLTKGNLYEEIHNQGFNGHFFEIYSAQYVLYEEEVARNSDSAAGWFPKGAVSHITVRNNTAIESVAGTMLQGSFGAEAGQLPHDHEFCWNNVRVTGGTGFLFSASKYYLGEHYGGSVYRNTVVGSPWPRFEGAEPYEYDGNVFIGNDLSRYNEDIMIHPVADDLLGAPADGIVDADNRLTGQWRADLLGQRGHEVQ